MKHVIIFRPVCIHLAPVRETVIKYGILFGGRLCPGIYALYIFRRLLPLQGIQDIYKSPYAIGTDDKIHILALKITGIHLCMHATYNCLYIRIHFFCFSRIILHYIHMRDISGDPHHIRGILFHKIFHIFFFDDHVYYRAGVAQRFYICGNILKLQGFADHYILQPYGLFIRSWSE